MQGNLRRNGAVEREATPDWLRPAAPVHRIGRGWAAAIPVDWTLPLPLEFPESDIDWIVASDCVWLVSMLDGLLNTVQAIVDRNRNRQPTFLMSFQRRDPKDGDDSAHFTSIRRVYQAVLRRGWGMKCLVWHPVSIPQEGASLDNENSTEQSTSEVYLFEIQPNPAS